MIITVCIGSSCHLKGSRQVVEGLQRLVARHQLQDKIEMKGQFCMGDCLNGVCVTIDGQKFSVRDGNVDGFFEQEVLPRLGA